MDKPLSLSGDIVILSQHDARHLATAIFSSADLARRHGAYLDPRILRIAASIHSAAGKTENLTPSFEDTAHYEQVNTQEAATILGCSPRNVRYLADKRRLPGVRRGNAWYFNRDDVETFRDYR